MIPEVLLSSRMQAKFSPLAGLFIEIRFVESREYHDSKAAVMSASDVSCFAMRMAVVARVWTVVGLDALVMSSFSGYRSKA